MCLADTHGRLWGWEDGKSCVFRVSALYNVTVLVTGVLYSKFASGSSQTAHA